MTIRRDRWNTYATYGYTHDVANDQKSAGGVHHHEIRKTKAGWQTRICQCNGNHIAYGPVESVDDAEGESLFAQAAQYEIFLKTD